MTADENKVSFQSDYVLGLAVMVRPFCDCAKTTESTKKTECYPYTLFLNRLTKSGINAMLKTLASMGSTYHMKF